jgi:hypothetical protein
MNALGKLVAHQGTYIVNDTEEAFVKCDAIFIAEDTIFSKIVINGIDVKDQYVASNAIAIKAGIMITPRGGYQFSSVKLVSGQVALIL